MRDRAENRSLKIRVVHFHRRLRGRRPGDVRPGPERQSLRPGPLPRRGRRLRHRNERGWVRGFSKGLVIYEF